MKNHQWGLVIVIDLISEKVNKLKLLGVKEYINSEFSYDFNCLASGNVVAFGIGSSIAKEFVSKQSFLNIVVIFDDLYKEDFFYDIPVLKTTDIYRYKNHFAVNLTFNIKANYFFNAVAIDNEMKVFNYYEVVQYFDFVSVYPYFNKILLNLMITFKDILRVLDFLDDDLSKEVILCNLYYRLTFDVCSFINVKGDSDKQYFDIDITGEDVFIDGGCFDGATAINLINKVGAIKKIYCFEPDVTNFNNSKKNLTGYNFINMHNVGLGSKEEDVYFLSTSDEISRVVEMSDKKIQTNTIDNLASDATVIKLDIEGCEVNAIIGACSTIKKNNPKLAVSIYHNPNDIFEIINLVRGINSRYSFYIRHYSDSIFDTILYGVVNE